MSIEDQGKKKLDKGKTLRKALFITGLAAVTNSQAANAEDADTENRRDVSPAAIQFEKAKSANELDLSTVSTSHGTYGKLISAPATESGKTVVTQFTQQDETQETPWTLPGVKQTRVDLSQAMDQIFDGSDNMQKITGVVVTMLIERAVRAGHKKVADLVRKTAAAQAPEYEQVNKYAGIEIDAKAMTFNVGTKRGPVEVAFGFSPKITFGKPFEFQGGITIKIEGL